MDLQPIKERIKKEFPAMTKYEIDKIVENSYEKFLLEEEGESNIGQTKTKESSGRPQKSG